MLPSRECVELVQHFETCSLVAYPDPASPLAVALRKGLPGAGLSGAPWTIGWGETGPYVRPGLRWTQEQADAAFTRALARKAAEVSQLLGAHGVTQSQFDALVSFAYNVGADIDDDTIAEGLGDSTLLRLLLAGDIPAAANEFPKWDKAGGQVLRGLTRRRWAERALFLGMPVAAAIRIGELEA